jgi:hypothetical protein
LVLSAATSMRCASHVMNIVLTLFNIPAEVPDWHTGRYWLMRIGYYKINREKEKADDWVWIIDHSVQIGSEKCLVILGIRLKNLPKNRPLRYSDVEPIDLIPVKTSNGEIVYEQLEEATKKTGIPREIIADHGPDLNAGINKFINKHKETTCEIYDIKHKTASILKRELENNESWKKFLEHCTKTKAQVQQTELAFSAPPNQRSKARYMNIDILVVWGNKILNFLKSEKDNPSGKLSKKNIEEKLSWILKFHEKINEWGNMMAVVQIVESGVRNNGLSNKTLNQLENELNNLTLCDKAILIKNELLSFLEIESSKAKSNEMLLGSSEIIESLFGKQKMLEKEQSKNGFTGLILAIGAFVSVTTKDVIKQAMNIVKTKTVLEWTKNKIGETVQSCRKKLLVSSTASLPSKNRRFDIRLNPTKVIKESNISTHLGNWGLNHLDDYKKEQKQNQISLGC